MCKTLLLCNLFRFLSLAALSAYICSRGLKILGFWVFQ
ncbi:putative membrane protein [Helicobacter pylori Hp P-23]|nr:putative membrane protein [Helicobacter pylori Hp P-23]